MEKITPCLWFDGQAEEAANFYVSLLPDSRVDSILRAPAVEAVSFVIQCEDQAEVDRLWDALTADGGKPVQCGWLQDRWGLSWQIVPAELFEMYKSPDKDAVRRAFEAMMTMVKLDLAELRRAFEG